MSDIQINFRTHTKYTPAELDGLAEGFADFMTEFGDEDVIPKSFSAKVLGAEDDEKKYTIEEFREMIRSGAKDVRISILLGDEECVVDIHDAGDDVEEMDDES